MTGFAPADPDYSDRVRASFARQTFLATIGAELTRLEPGCCELTLPFRPDLCQQHGFHHAGVTSTLADTACGYAAFSLMPAGSAVLTVEFKLNLLAPAAGERFVARAKVERPGRTLTVAAAEVLAIEGGVEKKIALMVATLICLPDSTKPG
jgi:uncharacterized protein (TIGR00369 family)